MGIELRCEILEKLVADLLDAGYLDIKSLAENIHKMGPDWRIFNLRHWTEDRYGGVEPLFREGGIHAAFDAVINAQALRFARDLRLTAARASYQASPNGLASLVVFSDAKIDAKFSDWLAKNKARE